MKKCHSLICFTLLNLIIYIKDVKSATVSETSKSTTSEQDEYDTGRISKLPTVMIVTMFRNKAHVLPYYLSYLEQLDYPKDRITLWFRSDHNEDNTAEILDIWLKNTTDLYHHVNVKIDYLSRRRTTEKTITSWPIERHIDIIDYKEQALNYGRKIWSDFVFFLDADIFLTDKLALRYLIQEDLAIVAPMVVSDGLYSNFWGGMSEKFYYERTPEYKEIYNYNKTGEFRVPMIHSAVLVNLNDQRTDLLTFNRTLLNDQLEKENKLSLNDTVPMDDIIIFAISAKYAKIPLYISNNRYFGYIMVPLDQDDFLGKDLDQLTNLKIFIVNDIYDGIVLNENLKTFAIYPEFNQMTLSKVFMINLERRPERRKKMEQSFLELGIDVVYHSAVDGKKLTDESIKSYGIQFLSGYADPYHNRPMTMGEIGCFLSHYQIWERIFADQLNEVLVLEDDIRFEPYFKERAIEILQEAREIGGWDLIYFGRKRLQNQDEKPIGNSDHLVKAGYSYWTLGYVITKEGAKKLLDAKPLKQLLPVDEFLPIMFDQHINSTWKTAFPNRNLIAWSTSPLLVFPTHYTGEDGYISDTEDSVLIKPDEDLLEPRKEKKGNKENLDSDEINENAATNSIDGNIEIDELINDATFTNNPQIITEPFVKSQNMEL